MRRPRLVLLLTLALLALGAAMVRGDPSGSGSTTAAAATATAGPPIDAKCAATLRDPKPPVLEGLKTKFNESLARTIFALITDTAAGKLLADPVASNCIANMNGTVLGDSLLEGLATSQCAAMTTIMDIPMVRDIIGTVVNKTAVDVATVLKFMKGIKNEEIEQICGIYATGLVPCISSQLLPSLAVVRAQYSNGCCDAWVTQVRRDYGYTISGQVTKMLQLFGDLMCAKQTPSFSGEGSQRCGYTLLQTMIPKPNMVATSAAFLRSIQVPTDQMCLRAEGQPYTDLNGKKVAKAADDEAFPSGCVIPMDRIATWLYGLPAADRADPFDLKALMGNKRCLKGSEIFPFLKNLFPDLLLDEVQAHFANTCAHVPMKYSDACTFSRPVALIDWPNDPTPLKPTDPTNAPTTGSSDATVVKSAPTQAPTKTTPASSTASSTGLTAMVIVASVMAFGVGNIA